MTKSTKNTKAVAQGNVTTKATHELAIGTVVVHNYTTFAHGVIVAHNEDGSYMVNFPADMAPTFTKYQANTEEAAKLRTRKLTHGKGFFKSKHKSIEKVRALQRIYASQNVETL